jgi:lipopolysaccharide export system permease protein
MKIIDRFLIKSFIPPFLVAFGVALFVLIMQFLWLYIDEIMGKGLSIFEVVELLFYLSVGLFPQAFPIGVLIASVMVMGNLAERYELSSFKSAGVSLIRIMRPLMLVGASISLFSIFTSEVLIPWSNLKFYSRFYDIRKSKPALNLEAGVFNDEFAAYTMRIGKKSADGRKIENVLIYGNKEYNTTTYNQTMAKNGEMLTTADKQFFVMNLYDGVQFQETSNTTSSGKFPFVRIKYKSWQKIFDLTEFDRRKTDEDLFRSSQKTQSSRQLLKGIDSMKVRIGEAQTDMLREMRERLTPFKTPVKIQVDTTVKPISDGKNTSQSAQNQGVVHVDAPLSTKAKKDTKTPLDTSNQPEIVIGAFGKDALDGTPYAGRTLTQQAPKDTFINRYLTDNFYDITKKMPTHELAGFYQKSQGQARMNQTAIENMTRNNQVTFELRSKYTYELNLKYVFALICFVFLFIGAPMGAIVQKGGFGYPILVAIIFFMVFMIGVIYCKNLRDGRSLSGTEAAWIPFLLMLPIAALLTWRAVNDYKLNFDGIGKNLKNFFLLIADKIKQFRPRTAIFLLVFAVFRGGGIWAQKADFPIDSMPQIDTTVANGEVIEDEDEEETPYVSPYIEASKKYNNETIETRAFSADDWRKATQGIDYQSDVEKERQPKKASTPLDGAWLAVLVAFLKWFFIIAAVFLLGYLILRFVTEGNIFSGKSRRLGTSEVIDLAEIEDNLEQAELDPLIRKAIEARNFPLATRLYYLAILKELTLKNAIAWKRDKTNRAYMSEMHAHPLFESFRTVTGIFERVWYGDSLLDGVGFNQIQPKFQDLLNQTRR